MARETVISGPSDDDDEDYRPARSSFDMKDPEFDERLRPQRLADVVGQRKVVDRLQIMIDAARLRKEPLGHLLLDGPPGLGKTTFATVLPKELGVECLMTSGPLLSAPKDLLPHITNAGPGAVLFIDEIHRMSPAVEEFIYPVMEDFRVDITLGDGLNARTINMQVDPFTIIGATTRSGMLTAPLRDRFVNRLHVDFYEVDELTEIITRNARKMRVEIGEEAAFEIARRSRSTPRIANNLLSWVRDFATVKAKGNITKAVAKDALAMQEVDELGLEAQHRRYLTTIVKTFGGGPAGVQAIGHSVNIPVDTLEDEVEPFLLRLGLIQRTPRGRVITADGMKHLGIAPPEMPGQSTLF
jgi:holliday junction DNA helicase RuvB